MRFLVFFPPFACACAETEPLPDVTQMCPSSSFGTRDLYSKENSHQTSLFNQFPNYPFKYFAYVTATRQGVNTWRGSRSSSITKSSPALAPPLGARAAADQRALVLFADEFVAISFNYARPLSALEIQPRLTRVRSARPAFGALARRAGVRTNRDTVERLNDEDEAENIRQNSLRKPDNRHTVGRDLRFRVAEVYRAALMRAAPGLTGAGARRPLNYTFKQS
ncbi:hypothetical protein EVAR_43219_1 [Eumeta japonica]|uniref:Uncharacterized protein n=1 Tax=Eumeta variegata TaxID=151549 RepID=A0A4C1WVV1_EUMVA|nr:hypothetical protein EVAR_43219_1 [Eumeta japonica]